MLHNTFIARYLLARHIYKSTDYLNAEVKFVALAMIEAKGNVEHAAKLTGLDAWNVRSACSWMVQSGLAKYDGAGYRICRKTKASPHPMGTLNAKLRV